MTLYVGTSGYSYPKWKGSFYPAKLPAARFLRFYGEHFRSVEINQTFYALPKPEAVEKWAADVPAQFRFVLKSPQRITHFQRLRNATESVAAFLAVAGVLKDRLGPLLFQLPPNFKKDAPRLREFLGLLPTHHRVAFEFRHQSWFDDEVFAVLREHRAALCLAEAEGDLDVPFVSTADWGYLRLRKPEYGDRELKDWLRKVKRQDWADVFVFFKHEDEGTGPKFARRLLELAGG
jgi:uncharacterized protein YecE (DUF72 family)